VVFDQDVELVYMMPHMHVPAKGHEVHAGIPDGRKEVVLNGFRTNDFNGN